MSTRLDPEPPCPCLAPGCRAIRRTENIRVAWVSAAAVLVITCSLWAVELWRITP